MKYLRWASTAALLAGSAYSARELLKARDMLSQLAAAPQGGANPLKKTVESDLAQMKLLSVAAAAADGRIGDAVPGAPPAAAPAAPRVFGPRPEHAEFANAADGPGRVVSGRGGERAPVAGGAVLTDASGRRLELVPGAPPPASARAASAVKELARALPQDLSLPSLDDPRLGLEQRKRRAQLALAGTALAAFVLAWWARRYKA